ncbi:acyl carrier protein [Butyricimonas paravirosa]|uniref:acyl carrier protein n=1 Tax=Butyricimonas paravirosa TaxID=1472417 RepID=UPI00210B16FA|nr:acyl carrier protein [Butyricimonas paravirosa]MCQ4872516.1 acyl carrier protein [Butyricimonas paravirosa]
MTNLEKYNQVFVETFSVEEDVLDDQFAREHVGNWDSVRQLSLVSNLEDTFDIMFDTEDILGMVSYKEGKNIMLKYEIEL